MAYVAVRSKAVVLLLLAFCLLLLPLWESVIVLCFVVRYFMSILVLQSSWCGRESWVLCLICLPCVSWWLSGSSSRCCGLLCSVWFWYLLIILTYFFSIKVLWHKCTRQQGGILYANPLSENIKRHSFLWILPICKIWPPQGELVDMVDFSYLLQCIYTIEENLNF